MKDTEGTATFATQEYDESGTTWNPSDDSGNSDESLSEGMDTLLLDRREGSKRTKKAPKRLTYDKLGIPSARRRSQLRSQGLPYNPKTKPRK